jgi:branched-chain amino acid transport system permease protein
MFNFLRDVGVNIILSLPLIGAYALFALGIVVIYRASRVLNLAHGAMATVPGYIAYSIAPHAGAFVGVAAGIASGGLLGVVVERFVVRRLRAVSQTAQTVGTVAVFAVIVALVAKIWGTVLLQGVGVVPHATFHVGYALMSTDDLALFVVAAIAAVGFFALFRFTNLGFAMRLAADNRRAASLMGVDPERTTSAAWLIGGLFAGLGGALLAGDVGLHPYILSLQVLPAFVAALIGGLDSSLGALVGAAIVGVAIGIVPSLGVVGEQVGAPQLVLAALAFVIMGTRGSRFQASDVRSSLG